MGERVARRIRGLVIASEWLDNIPVDVAEMTPDGPRIMLVDPGSGAERPGPAAGPAEQEWLRRWWPLRHPGERAELGPSSLRRVGGSNPAAGRAGDHQALDFGLRHVPRADDQARPAREFQEHREEARGFFGLAHVNRFSGKGSSVAQGWSWTERRPDCCAALRAIAQSRTAELRVEAIMASG